MPGEAVQARKEPVRGLRPLFMGAIASAALILSSCAPVQLALDRVGNARNTSFKPTSSCPSIEGDKNNALFYLADPTTSLKIEDGLRFNGRAYSNRYYTICLMDNASNAYVLEPNGTLVGVFKKGLNGSYMDGTKAVFKLQNNVIELVEDSDFLFGNSYGRFALKSGSIRSSLPIVPRETPITTLRRSDDVATIDFINNEFDSSKIISTALLCGLLLIIGGSIVSVLRISKRNEIANRNRSHGTSTIPDVFHPNPILLKKEPIPTFRHPPSWRPLPPIIIEEEEPKSLMDDD